VRIVTVHGELVQELRKLRKLVQELRKLRKLVQEP
jgi:hypothetical protein